MILSLSSTPAQDGAWRVSESQWVGLLIPPSKAREPCPTSASVTEGLVAGDLKERQEDYSGVSPVQGFQAKCISQFWEDHCLRRPEALAPWCRDPALSLNEEMSDNSTPSPRHSYQTLSTLPGQHRSLSAHKKKRGGGPPPSIRGTPGGGSVTKEEGQSLVVAIGTQAWLSERTISDWERLLELSPWQPLPSWP